METDARELGAQMCLQGGNVEDGVIPAQAVFADCHRAACSARGHHRLGQIVR